MNRTILKSDEAGRAKSPVERKKRRLERTMIGLALLAIISLTVIQTRVVRLGPDVPSSQSVILFVLINLNILLLFVLLVLVLRNLYKIFFEQRQIFGAQLRTKLVVAFVSLSMVPTGLLFYAGLQFITTGHEYWFNETVEKSLTESWRIAQLSLEHGAQFAARFGEHAIEDIVSQELYRPENIEKLDALLSRRRADFNMSLVEFHSPDFELRFTDKSEDLGPQFSMTLPAQIFIDAASSGEPQTNVESSAKGDLIRVVMPVVDGQKNLAAFLVVGYQTATPVKSRSQALAQGLEGYRQLKKLQDPIRVSHYIALTIVALLSIFMSTWIGFHLAKGITGPIMDLAHGTERIAHGDYDVVIDAPAGAGEIRTLVESFNRMTGDLKASRSQLTEKNLELVRINTELDQRRRYIEIILHSVAAGVISADADGIVTTINESAQKIFQLPADRVLGRPFTRVMAPEHKAILDDLIRSAETSLRGAAERQVTVKIGDRPVSLHVHLSRLVDENGLYLGLVLVFDDLTELEKAQRMAAWREVARRIAHEIKNPLTPIQLSTQRLRRRYGDRLADDGQLFDECTQMIIRQVDELKRLVDEFSNFARMPAANPTPNDLAGIVGETLVMYQEGHQDIAFVFDLDPQQAPPVFNLDREQIMRVVINLLDNAVAAVGQDGRIDISLTYDRLLKLARLEVADNGAGISPADRQRLFEPYYSTKKSGTGLGLAIVSTIVADHDGFVRIQDNHPRGTRFIIELPVKQ